MWVDLGRGIPQKKRTMFKPLYAKQQDVPSNMLYFNKECGGPFLRMRLGHSGMVWHGKKERMTMSKLISASMLRTLFEGARFGWNTLIRMGLSVMKRGSARIPAWSRPWLYPPSCAGSHAPDQLSHLRRRTKIFKKNPPIVMLECCLPREFYVSEIHSPRCQWRLHVHMQKYFCRRLGGSRCDVWWHRGTSLALIDIDVPTALGWHFAWQEWRITKWLSRPWLAACLLCILQQNRSCEMSMCVLPARACATLLHSWGATFFP